LDGELQVQVARALEPTPTTNGVKVRTTSCALESIVNVSTAAAQLTETTRLPGAAVVKVLTTLQTSAGITPPLVAMASAIIGFAALKTPIPSETRDRIVKSWYAGRAMAAKIPMIATTIISSISVKPCSDREREGEGEGEGEEGQYIGMTPNKKEGH
jgi:hypothetical protein